MKRIETGRQFLAAALACVILVTGAALAQQSDAGYERGRDAIEDGRWAEAVREFDEVIAAGGRRADAALYWKAYALERDNQTSEALETLSELRASYPDSTWKSEARNLEREIRRSSDSSRSSHSERERSRDRSSGRDVHIDVHVDHDFDEDDAQEMALHSLLAVDAETALPILRKFLEGDHSTDLKEQAMFVLIQQGTPEAFDYVADIARDGSDAELQEAAIQHLGIFGGSRSLSLLEDVYGGTDNVEVKQAILGAFMLGGNKERVLRAAREERSEDLRSDAVNLLGVMNATAELAEMYEAETSVELKAEILQAFMIAGDRGRVMDAARSETGELQKEAVQLIGIMGGSDELRRMYHDPGFAAVKEEILQGLFISGDSQFLLEVVETETDPEIRGEAIQALALTGDRSASATLKRLYREEGDPEIRQAALQGLFMQEDVSALIEIARGETDPRMKREVVQLLATMNSKEARDYMLELLNE